MSVFCGSVFHCAAVISFVASEHQVRDCCFQRLRYEKVCQCDAQCVAVCVVVQFLAV